MAVPAGFMQHISGYWMKSSDQSGPYIFDGTNMVPAQPINTLNVSSGNVAAASAVATLAAVAAKTNFLTGFEVTASGATAGLPVLVTITGIVGGTLTYVFSAPTGASVGATPLAMSFTPPLAASAVNTAIVVTCPSLGAGNTNAATVAHGFQV